VIDLYIYKNCIFYTINHFYKIMLLRLCILESCDVLYSVYPKTNIPAPRPAVIFIVRRNNDKKKKPSSSRHLDYVVVVMTNNHIFLGDASFLVKYVYSRTIGSKPAVVRGTLSSFSQFGECLSHPLPTHSARCC